MDVSNWKAKYKAVYEVLSSVPRTWETVDTSQFGRLQENTLQLLIDAGLVEIKRSVRLVLPGHPISFDSTFTTTGVNGPKIALIEIIEDLQKEWGKPIVSWVNDGMDEKLPFQVVLTNDPKEWRLSDQGEIALDEFDTSYPLLLGYVLREGFPAKLRPDCEGYGTATLSVSTEAALLLGEQSQHTVQTLQSLLEEINSLIDKQTETLVDQLGNPKQKRTPGKHDLARRRNNRILLLSEEYKLQRDPSKLLAIVLKDPVILNLVSEGLDMPNKNTIENALRGSRGP